MLHSLLRQTEQRWDLLLLDDGSGSIFQSAKPLMDVLSKIKLEGHDIRMLRNDFSLGVCRARQQLVDADPWKENEWIVRLDDDCILEPDYLERLHDIIIDEGYKTVGIVSGVTPLFGAPPFVRETRFVSPVINKIEFDQEGNIVTYNDDCGLEYDMPLILNAHQFRSMAMFRRELFDKVKYPRGLSPVGFREEAHISLQAAWEGWKCVVNLAAIAHHAPCRFNTQKKL